MVALSTDPTEMLSSSQSPSQVSTTSTDPANVPDHPSPPLGTEDAKHTAKASRTGLGETQQKAYVTTSQVLALFSSLICLGASICVVSPRLPIAWRLGFEGQIIAVGFLLSLMNLCLKTVVPSFLALLEARFGPSRLQNYDAVLTDSFIGSRASLHWRVIIIGLLAFPMLLSLGYKRLIGGQSVRVLEGETLENYGLTTPPLGLYSAVQNSVFLATSASAHFLATSRNFSQPSSTQFPVAYGFNMLLLDNSSAALLDMPESRSLMTAQRKLARNEFWHLSASVDATVARYNPSDEYKKNSTIWNQAFDGSLYSLNSFYQYNGYYFGLLVEKQTTSGAGRCYLGSYQRQENYWNPTVRDEDPDDLNAQFFRSAALMFDVRRERCTGTWKIDKNDVTLIRGSCTNTPTNQDAFATEGGKVFYLDALPVLTHTLGDFATVQSQSLWRLPSFATSVAAMYWARLTWIAGKDSPGCDSSKFCYRAPDPEHISSTRPALESTPVLYLILAIQPALTLAALLINRILYPVPLGGDFGLVAILSGIDPDALSLLRGAALSGELREPVNVGITVVDRDDVGTSPAAKEHPKTGQIKYTLDTGSTNIGRLRRQVKYE